MKRIALLLLGVLTACTAPLPSGPTSLPTLVPVLAPTAVTPTRLAPAVAPSPVAPVIESPTVIGSLTPASDSGRVSFSDANVGIAFSYPADWKILARAQDEPPGVTLHAPPFGPGPEPIIFAITVDALVPTSNTVSSVVQDQLNQVPADLQKGIQRRQTAMGGEPAEEVIGLPSRSGAIETFAVHKDRLYLIILQPYDPDNPLLLPALAQARAVYDELLTSIRFLK